MDQKIKNKQLLVSTDFDFNNKKLINLASPSGNTDAVNKYYVDTKAINYALGSGLYSGGKLSIIDATHFAITSGVGYIVDPITKDSTRFEFPAISSVTLMTLGPYDSVVFIGVQSNGTIFQQPTQLDGYQRRIMVKLGEFLLYPTNQVLEQALTDPVFSWDSSSSVDSFKMEGIMNISGNNVGPSGSTLQMFITSGTMYGYSINSEFSYSNPNERTFSSVSGFTFKSTWYNGVDWAYTGTGRTITPNLYSNGTSTLQSVSSNKWSVRLIMRGAFSGSFYVSYPTQTSVYNDSASAIADIQNLHIMIPDELSFKVLPCCILVVRGGATNLSSSSDAVFVPVRSMPYSAGTTGSVSAIDVFYNNSGTTNIASNNVQGALNEVNSKIETLNWSRSEIDVTALSGLTGTTYKATNTTIVNIPRSYVRVEINSLEVTVGNGTKNECCFFSNDGGITARTYDNVALGDTLYWNGSYAPYLIDSTDKISFIYMIYSNS